MPDERLDPGPVAPGVSRTAPEQPAGVDVDRRGYPALASVGQQDVVGGDQPGLLDIDQPVAEDVRVTRLIDSM